MLVSSVNSAAFAQVLSAMNEAADGPLTGGESFTDAQRLILLNHTRKLSTILETPKEMFARMEWSQV
jgi:hypothetical protein